MSGFFEVRKDSPAQRRAMGAYIAVMLEELLPPLRLAARGCGYALAVHGSLQRDIDLVAIPWVEGCDAPDYLVERLVGILAGVFGRAVRMSDWSEKPHGRRAITIITSGDTEIDLSIMPLIKKEPADG